MLDVKQHLAASRVDLRRFGLLFLGIMALLSLVLLWQGSPAWKAALIAGAVFLVMAAAIPEALRPFYVAWMTLGALLAWVNTRLILGALFYLVMTPIGFAMKLFGRDILGTKIDPEAGTYWAKRTSDGRGKSRYEQMF